MNEVLVTTDIVVLVAMDIVVLVAMAIVVLVAMGIVVLVSMDTVVVVAMDMVELVAMDMVVNVRSSFSLDSSFQLAMYPYRKFCDLWSQLPHLHIGEIIVTCLPIVDW